MTRFLWDRLARWQPGFSPRLYKSALVALLASSVAVPLIIVGLPFIEFLNGMAAQPKARTQMTYGRVFGQELIADRSPAEGTLPQGYVPLVLPGKAEKIDDAKALAGNLPNPVVLTLENLRRGQNRFEAFCIACHGEKADGNGGVIGPTRFPAPPSLHTEQARQYTDGTIFYVITKGMGKMPAYADKLSPEDRWKVIHYVRALQLAANPNPAASRPAASGPVTTRAEADHK